MDDLRRNRNGSEALVELDRGVGFKGPDNHFLQALGMEACGERPDERAACAAVLILLQEVDGIELRVVILRGIADGATGHESDDAGFVAGHEDTDGGVCNLWAPAFGSC